MDNFWLKILKTSVKMVWSHDLHQLRQPDVVQRLNTIFNNRLSNNGKENYNEKKLRSKCNRTKTTDTKTLNTKQ